MRTFVLRSVPIVLFFALCLFLWRGLSLNPHHLPSERIGKPIAWFTLKQLPDEGGFFTPKDFHAKVVLLNIWASWCEACIAEQSFLLDLAEQGVAIYGINYKDKAESALQWLQTWGNPYQRTGQDSDGKLAIDLGVYGAPETFVLDKKGVIRYRHVGIITAKDWQLVIKPLVQELEQQS